MFAGRKLLSHLKVSGWQWRGKEEGSGLAEQAGGLSEGPERSTAWKLKCFAVAGWGAHRLQPGCLHPAVVGGCLSVVY